MADSSFQRPTLRNMMEKQHQGSVLGAGLFIAATNIGVAYYIIPIMTGIAGFVPAISITLVMWAFTLAVALLFAEATLGQPDGSNLISISKALVGKTAAIIFAIVFSINMLSYTTAYVYLIEHFFSWFFRESFTWNVPPFFNGLISTVPFFIVIFLGLRASIRVNAVLILALLASFGMTMFHGQNFIQKDLLQTFYWENLFYSVPILFSAFGFVGIVPPMCTYLNRDPQKIRAAIWIGTLIPLFVYILWQWFVIGSIRAGDFWLLHEEGVELKKVLHLLEHFPDLSHLIHFTIFFSMTTSLIGNGMAMIEFLSDGLSIPLPQRKGWKRFFLCLALLIAILLFSLVRGERFFTLMEYFTSPIGEVLINGIVPVWLVAQARYAYRVQAPLMLPGKHYSLMILGVAIFILIYLEGIEFIRS